jgi:hypothetical protein
MISEKDFIKEGYKSKTHYFSELRKDTGLKLETIRELSKELEEEEFYFQLMEDSLYNPIFRELAKEEEEEKRKRSYWK